VRSPDKKKKIGKDETTKYKVAPSTSQERSKKRKYGSSGLARATADGGLAKATADGNYEL